MLDDLMTKLRDYGPLSRYKFGHTPVQMEYFKVSSQQGDETFEYWHQVLQLRSLYDALRELEVDQGETRAELELATSWWPVWSRRARQLKIPRLKLRQEKIENSILEKTQEAEFHLALLKTKFAHLEGLSEEEIFAKDRDYWATRLSRQLAVNHLSRALGVGDGDLAAVLSLPKEQQEEVLGNMVRLVEASKTLLPQGKTGA